jgi:DNA-binding MarR family transcriptional regulator
MALFSPGDVMMTSQVLRELESKSLVSRTVSASDKRTIVIAPPAMDSS